jgi:hypothetical protein
MTLYGAAPRPSALTAATSAATALTEDSGAIGGTNDSDLPAIGTVSGTYSQAEVVAIRDAVREVAAAYNALRADHVALLAKHNALLARLKEG